MASLVVLGDDEGKFVRIRFLRVGKKKGRGKFYLVVCWEINIFPKGSWNTGFWVSEYVSKLKVKVRSLRRVWLFVTPWTVACQLLYPWDFSGKSTGVGCHFLLQGIFPTQRLNPNLLHWQVNPLPLNHQGRPPTSWPPHLNPITSQRSSLWLPFYWELGLLHMNL